MSTEEQRRYWRELTRKHRAAHPESVKNYTVRHSERRKKLRQTCRVEALTHYGTVCYCCGESEPMFLALDHIHGGGSKHKREIKCALHVWAKRNGWPPVFRVACHSCNVGAYLNGGICPHQTRETNMRNMEVLMTATH